MKKGVLSLTMVLVMLLSYMPVIAVNAEANSTIEEWSYEMFTYDGIDGASVTGYNGSDTDVFVPANIDISKNGETVSYPVLKVGDNTFKNNTKINSVTLSENVKAIGDGAFEGAENMVCIVTNEGLEEIGKNAFKDCGAFNSVILGDRIKQIGSSAFLGCENLTVYLNSNSYAHQQMNLLGINYVLIDPNAEGVTCTVDGIEYLTVNGSSYIKGYGQYVPSEVTIPAVVSGFPVTEVLSDAFAGCAITKITLPNTLNKIGSGAFMGATLAEVNLPQGLQMIGYGAFGSCEYLREFIMPDTVTDVSVKTFAYCTNLKNVHLSTSLSSLIDATFRGCAIEEITIPKSITTMDADVFEDNDLKMIYVYENSYAHQFAKQYGYAYTIIEEPASHMLKIERDGIQYGIIDNKATVLECNTDITTEEISIPSNIDGYEVTAIGGWAFSGETDITVITLPNTITTIGDSAFADCINLEKINMSNSIETIEKCAFKNCSSLTDIEIPETMKSIKEFTFANCTNLTSVTIHEGIKHIKECAFSGCGALTKIKIPKSVLWIDTTFSPVYYIDVEPDPFKGKTFVVYLNSYAYMYALDNNISCEVLTDTGEIYNGSDTSLIYGYREGINSGEYFITENSTYAEFIDGNVVTIPAGVLYIRNIYVGLFRSTLYRVYENSYVHNLLKEFGNELEISYTVIQETPDITVVDSHSISGTVTSVSGVAKQNAAVTLLDKNANILQTSFSDMDGAYVFPEVKVGTYTIRAEDSDGNIGTDRISIKRKSLFEVYMTGNTHITIQDNASVKGTVTDENSKALPNINMSLIDDTGVVFATGKTGMNGEYEFSNVPNGTYLLRGEDNTGGAVIQEVTVFAPNGDAVIDLKIFQGATITGNIIDDKNDAQGNAEVIVTNSTGERVSLLYTDENGKYTAGNLPTGTYHISAVSESGDGELRGEGYFVIEKTGNIQVDDIVIKAKVNATASISGKVTAHGQVQVSSVVMKDIFMNEIAVCNTSNNGKYNFLNIPDGTYTIVATTTAEGAGFTTVTIKDGKLVSGNTSITVYKTGTVEDLETQIDLLPSVDSSINIVSASKNAITKAKTAYDALSNKDKKRVSQDKVDKLNMLISIIMSENLVVETENDVKISGLETVWSSDDIAGNADSQVVLNVTENSGITAFAENAASDEQFDNQRITQKAEEEGKTIIKCYDVSLEKITDSSTKQIRNIKKDSVGMGSVTITMDIPEQYRGHKNYSVIHMHNGQIYTLADIDDNDNTVTVETDKFSDFVLTFDDNNNSHQGVDQDISYDAVSKTATIHSVINTTADVIFASYYQGQLVDVTVKENKSIVVGDNPITAEDLDVSSSDEVKIMVWDSLKNMKPIFDMLSINV